MKKLIIILFSVGSLISAGTIAETICSMNGYESKIESWLDPLKPNYPADSPWWSFYKYAKETSKAVDCGKIPYQEGVQLIENRRLKLNQEIAALVAPKVVTLNCTLKAEYFNGISIPEQQIALTIDYKNSTVNGITAKFYDTEIRWDNPTNDGSYFHSTLNRLSGFFSYGSDQFAVVRSGQCAPATRKF